MRIRMIFAAVAALACLLGPAPAGAWGAKGHRIVGELAQRRLTERAGAEVLRLLDGEAEATLAGVSDWPDDLRKDDPVRGPRTERWHYVNLPAGCGYDAARDCPDGQCVVAAIPAQYAILADPAQPDAARREALKFLVHLVADIHQPLHAGHKRDAGGNRFQVNVDGEGTNLHQVWDRVILQQRKGDARANADALHALPPLPWEQVLLADVSAWATQSCAIVESQGFYPARPGVLPSGYLAEHQAVAEVRLRLAAIRLADLLNWALAPPVIEVVPIPGVPGQ